MLFCCKNIGIRTRIESGFEGLNRLAGFRAGFGTRIGRIDQITRMNDKKSDINARQQTAKNDKDPIV
ncbi:MAG: hypothetical protein ACXWCZ_05295 [Flavisolibacter sp.]